jgi:hypothetical protein
VKRYQGPCQHCGIAIDRKFRPGRERLCIDCALAKAAHQHRRAAAGVDSSIAKGNLARAEFAAQVAARSGPLYDKWLAGILRAAGALNDTDVA